MSKLFMTLAVLVAIVVGLGFYRGWFTLSSGNPETGGDKVDVNLSVDRDKMREDAASVRKQTGELVGSTPATPAPKTAEKPADKLNDYR